MIILLDKKSFVIFFEVRGVRYATFEEAKKAMG